MLRARLYLLLAAALFSSGGAVIKSCGLSSWQIACFRSGIALVAVLLLGGSIRSAWSRPAALTGLAYAATMILFVTANKLTTAASTIFLQSTAPLWMIVLSVWVLREPIRRRDFAFFAAFVAGLAFFLGDDAVRFATAPDPRRGNVLAALSGLSWALTVGGLRWIERPPRRGGGFGAVLVAGNAMTFLLALPFALPVRGAGLVDWALVGYLGVFQVALAYTFLGTGVRRVPAFEASLLLLIEPVLNPLWTWIVHGETPGPWTCLGGLTILGATTARVLLDRPGAAGAPPAAIARPRD